MKECSSCLTKETPQWYSGPVCKSCYRKQHRQNNLNQYKNKDAIFYLNNKERIKDRQNEYYKNNSEECKIRSKNHRSVVGNQRRPGYKNEWYAKNPEKAKEQKIRHYNKDPERARASWRKWANNNLPYARLREANRRAKKLQATPKWISKEQMDKIKDIYNNCPKGYHVDHIIPLLGKEVRGLHVPWNLQYLSAKDNIRKSNKM